MSRISRIEFANFINLDNEEPSSPDWCTHYPHLILNCGGQSTAIVATNGLGKSTINRALYSILTRDRSFTHETKKVCAPKRRGAYSHVRIELLYDSQPVGGLLGKMGGEIPGEPWVLGFYGNAGTDLTYYSYQGTLEDCPCVERRGTRIRVVPDKQFRQCLAGQREPHPVLTPEMSLEEVAVHFDPAMLSQLVAYQKAGGGDSAEQFFKVQRRGPDGQEEPYDAAFFYEHIAPEVLANAMQGFGKDGETRFEDTLYNSIAPLVSAEIKNERLDAKHKADKGTCSKLELVKVNLDDFLSSRKKLDGLVAGLGSEVSFLLDVTEARPLIGVPRVLHEHHEQTRHFANNLVLQNGQWLAPDALIGSVLEVETKNLNWDADRMGVTSVRLDRKQLIEIPCGSLADRRTGPAGRGYTKDAAAELIRARTGKFAAGWDKESATRALNYGFGYRATEGDTNPFRAELANLRLESAAWRRETTEVEASVKQKRDQQDQLVGNIQSLQADEYELQQIRRSRDLFTEAEIAALEETAALIPEEVSASQEAREAHERRQVKLNAGREAYTAYRAEHGDEVPPHTVLQRCTEERDRLTAERDKAKERVEISEERAATAALAAKDAREVAEHKSKERFEVAALLASVEVFEKQFPGENPVGLSAVVLQDRDNAVRTRQSKFSQGEALQAEESRLDVLAQDTLIFRRHFPDEEPDGLEVKVVKRLDHVVDRLRVLPEEQRQQEVVIGELRYGAECLDQVEKMANGHPIRSLEAKLRQDHEGAVTNAGALARQVALAEQDLQFLDTFGRHFNPRSVPVEVRSARAEELEQVSAKLASERVRAAGFRRQLEELKKSATAAGRIAAEVMEAIGGQATRVYQVVEQELGTDPRRAAVLTHFSHVLHAPVASSREEAAHMLSALEGAEIEAPVFWLDGLREFCSRARLLENEELVFGTLAGAKTLQVRGLVDPYEVERTRAQAAKRLTATETRILTLEDQVAELSEASRTSQIVRDACDAMDRGMVAKLDELKNKATAAAEQVQRLLALITEESVERIRRAQRFLDSGGQATLAASEVKLATLIEEQADLSNERPVAEVRASDEAIASIKQAFAFRDAGGVKRLNQVRADLAEIRETLDRLDAALPTLMERTKYIAEIDAAARFAQAGGREGLSALIAETEVLNERLATCEKETATTSLLARQANEAHQTLVRVANDATVKVAGSRTLLNLSQAYLDEGGLAFDLTYDNQLEKLRTAEKRAKCRAKPRFDRALRALNAEREGKTAGNMREDHDRLRLEIEASEERALTLRTLITDSEPRLREMEENMLRLDRVAHALLERRKHAKQALSDFEMPALLPETAWDEPVGRAMKTANRVRVALAELEEPLSAILDELEVLEEEIARFKLDTLIPEIRAAREQKDRAWTHYVKGCGHVLKDATATLSEADKALIEDGQTASTTHRFLTVFNAFEKHLGEQQRLLESTKVDLTEMRSNLAERLEAFTLNVGDNFSLLQNTLKPSKPGEAGFEVQAQVLGREAIRQAVEKVIKTIKDSERRRQEREGDDESRRGNKPFARNLKDEIRRSFYRAIFVGLDDEKLLPSEKGPRVFLRHPRIGKGGRIRMTQKISTGQANALALLLTTKMADFAISRDERTQLASAGRRRGSLYQTRVVMIDGLFSNVSNRKLVRESLDSLRQLQGKFQLIGWIHNETYENDPEIFPKHLGLQRVSDGSEGYVVVHDRQIDDEDEDVIFLGEGAVDVIEMHFEKLPEGAIT